MTFISLNEINSNEIFAPLGYEQEFIERINKHKFKLKQWKEYISNEIAYVSNPYERDGLTPVVKNKSYWGKCMRKYGFINIPKEMKSWEREEFIKQWIIYTYMNKHPFISHFLPKDMEERKAMGIKITDKYYDYFFSWGQGKVEDWKKKNMKLKPCIGGDCNKCYCGGGS